MSAPDIANRAEALDSIARRPEADQLVPLLASIADKPDPTLRTRKEVLASRLTATFGDTRAARIEAIDWLAGNLDIESLATLSQILSAQACATETVPEDANVAQVLRVGDDLSRADAYAVWLRPGLAPVLRVTGRTASASRASKAKTY